MKTTNFEDESYISVNFIGGEPDPLGGYRQVYGYSIVTSEWRYDGSDLRSGVGAEIDESAATGTLLAFLSAYADAYRQNSLAVLKDDMFPIHVIQWAYHNEDEIVSARIELEEV